jgi:hypothetical protein
VGPIAEGKKWVAAEPAQRRSQNKDATRQWSLYWQVPLSTSAARTREQSEIPGRFVLSSKLGAAGETFSRYDRAIHGGTTLNARSPL